MILALSFGPVIGFLMLLALLTLVFSALSDE